MKEIIVKLQSSDKETVRQGLQEYIKANADPNIRVPYKSVAHLCAITILEIAYKHNHITEFIALLKKGANPLPVLNDVLKNGSIEMLDACIKARPDILTMASFEDAKSALILSCEYNKLDAVKLLVGYGADVDAQGYRDESPLHTAVRSKNRDMVIYLLQNGADWKSKTSETTGGKTPKELAKYCAYSNRSGLLNNIPDQDYYQIYQLLEQAELLFKDLAIAIYTKEFEPYSAHEIAKPSSYINYPNVKNQDYTKIWDFGDILQ